MPQLQPIAEPVSREQITAVLDHLARYRLTIFPALERLPAFAQDGPRTIKSVLRECQSRGLIDAAPLHHGARYWFLQSSGAEQCNPRADRSGPLSEQAKIHALAMLRFCFLFDRPRHRLSADELADAFPAVARQGLSSSYYLDPQGASRIGLTRIDAAHCGRWDRILRVLSDDIADHLRQPDFRRLAQAGRFEITVLTVLPQKARRIRESLAQSYDAQTIQVQVVAIPELLPLVTSIR
jgi:hypothetical protein